MMHTLAQIPVNQGGLPEGLVMMLVGMLVVFTALILVAVVLWVMGRIDRTERPVPATTASSAPASAARPTPATYATPADQKLAPWRANMTKATEKVHDSGVDPHTLAVITAAAVAALGSRVRVRRVRFLRAGGGPWAEHGRASIHSSHHLQRRV